MADISNLPIENRSYVKSNEMISAKYKSTLLENQIMAIALTRIEENPNDPNNPLEAKLYPGELKRLVSDEAHIYRDLKVLSKSITGHSMILEDGKGNFKAFAVIPNAEYQDGVFTIKFNQVLKEHLLGLDKNFTTLELSVMTNFDRNSSFRIYELLKRDIFRSRPSVNNGRVDVEYNLFEFRFLIGLANSDNPYVQNRIKNMAVVDWEELYHVLEKYGATHDIKYKTTDKLQKDCLRPAQEELAEKSDIRFDYELRRIGRSYKRILFHIYPNNPNNKTELTERQRYLEKINGAYQREIPRDMSDETRQLYDKYVGHNSLTEEDLNLLFKYTDDPKDVAAAIEYADTQKHIVNYMGYIVTCLKERFFDNRPVEVISGSKETADSFRVLNERSHSSEIKKMVWENIKKQEDFEKFLECMQQEQNLTFYELDELLDANQSSKMYMDWRLSHKTERASFKFYDAQKNE